MSAIPTEAQSAKQKRARGDWIPPGPVPCGHQGAADLVPAPGETLDALCGHWRIFQRQGGHRYSSDDLLAAWYAVDCCRHWGKDPQDVLDLGTGIGTIGLMLAWTFPGARVTGLEIQAASAALARRSARYNGARLTVREGDLRKGIPGGPYDLVTASPPYWPPQSGTLSVSSQKSICRFELTAGIEDYLAAGREVLANDGRLVLVYDGRQQDRMLKASRAAGLQPVRIRPVISREGDPPLLVLLALAHGGTCSEEQPLLLRGLDGRRSPEFDRLRQKMGFPPSRG